MTTDDSKREITGRHRESALLPVPQSKAGLPSGYIAVLSEIKERIRQTRLHTVLSANAAMTLMCWEIGQVILKRQDEEGWGAMPRELKGILPTVEELEKELSAGK